MPIRNFMALLCWNPASNLPFQRSAALGGPFFICQRDKLSLYPSAILSGGNRLIFSLSLWGFYRRWALVVLLPVLRIDVMLKPRMWSVLSLPAVSYINYGRSR